MPYDPVEPGTSFTELLTAALPSADSGVLPHPHLEKHWYSRDQLSACLVTQVGMRLGAEHLLFSKQWPAAHLW